MSTKTLRVCLAMGGGVALGSFSGSALTEALKLLLIFGKDKDGNSYKDVVVDGMSGASAGAIALTIMLRCLIDYKSMLLKWKPRQNEEKESEEDLILKREQELMDSLKNTYFNEDPSLLKKFDEGKQVKKIPSLIALELAQKIQEILWVKKVTALKLYGETKNQNYKADLNDSFGLLERSYMEDLISEYLLNEIPKIDNVRVLDKGRVIFACSLTNILPMPINIPGDTLTKLQANVFKSTGVFNHAELRVMDYVFDQNVLNKKPSDDRWLQFSSNPKIGSKTSFDISKDESWSIISASALACGAFPIAFSPVLLKRYQEEYNISHTYKSQGEDIRSSNLNRSTQEAKDGKELITEWPKAFVDLQEDIAQIPDNNRNSIFDDQRQSQIDYTTFNFPYIDGGTFNNEPIKEAYKIASFQDYDRNDSTVERLVLFVDPIVRKEQNPSFKVSSFSPITGKGAPKKANELTKLISSTTSLISLLKDQGRIKESTKIKGVKENFELRDVLFTYLDENDKIKLNPELCIKAFKKVFQNLTDSIISIGTRHPISYFIKKLEQYGGTKWQGKPFAVLYENKDIIMGDLLSDNPNISLDKIYNTFGIKDKTESINIFTSTVFKVISDVSLGTAGKDSSAINAAILPINLKKEIIDLPGTEIAAFAGFASLSSKEYAFQYGRLSTLLALGDQEGFRNVENGGAFIGDISLATLDDTKIKITKKIRESDFFASSNDYSTSLKTGLFEPTIKRLQVVLTSKWKGLKRIWRLPLAPGLLIGGPFISIIVGLFSGGSNIVKGKMGTSIEDYLKATLDEAADAVDYMENIPLTISIFGKNFKKPWYKRLRKRKEIKITFKTKKGKYTQKAIRISSKKDSDSRILFRLYLIKLDKKAIKQSGGFTSSRDPTIRLVAEKRNRLPSSDGKEQALDPNIDMVDWLKEYNKNLPDAVETIKIDGFKGEIKISDQEINERSKTLYHSLKSIEFHVNPMLELDINNKSHDWYFKENTVSFDEKILVKSQTTKKKTGHGNS